MAIVTGLGIVHQELTQEQQNMWDMTVCELFGKNRQEVLKCFVAKLIEAKHIEGELSENDEGLWLNGRRVVRCDGKILQLAMPGEAK